jgi:hypothetical protein
MLAAVGWAYLAYAWSLDTPGIPGLGAPGAIVCPFRLLTGLSCPLCGTTRAWHAALHGHWSEAFSQHPVMPLLLPLAIAVTALLSASAVISVLRSRPSFAELST